MDKAEELLAVRGLRVEFPAAGSGGRPVRAVDGLDLDLARGEGLALLGESGSGKTSAALAIAGLLPASARASGSVRLDGRELLGARESVMRGLRGSSIGFVFQEPATALNPVIPAGGQVAEAAAVHGRTGQFAMEAALAALRAAGVDDAGKRYGAYPHELSGGLRQRFCIAMAVVNRPKLLIADEPTSALDVSVQAGIVDLLGELRRAFRMGLLLITHDVKLAVRAADRGLVMYAGRPVELAGAAELLTHPLHPYTKALVAATPRLHSGKGRLADIPGSVPAAGGYPAGCRFAPRCRMAGDLCRRQAPALVEVLPGRWVACSRVGAGQVREPLPEVRL